MLDQDDLSVTQPELRSDYYRSERLKSLTAGLQRLSHWVHMRSWRLWATQRLTPTQLKVVQLLAARDEGLTLNALARELCLSAATVCDSVRALKNKELLTKERSTQDRRQLTVQLTAAGRARARQIALSEPLNDAFRSLTKSEEQSLSVLWMKIIHALEELDALPPSRTCVRCQFFRPWLAAGTEAPHFCGQVKRFVPESAMPWDCRMFAAADPMTQSVAWDALNAGLTPGISSKPQFEDSCGDPPPRAVQDSGG